MSATPGTEQPRPRQVTWAGWMIMLGSAFIVLTVWEVVSGLRSLETRESIESFLGEAPGSDLGLDVEGAIGILRVMAMVSAGCATAAGVLGWHVLRRHRGARIALSVLALPIFVSGLATGGFLSSLVVVASVMLWISPSREWFAGKPLPEPTPRKRPTDDGRDLWGVPRQQSGGQPPDQGRAPSPAQDAGPSSEDGTQPPPATHAFGAPPPAVRTAPTRRPGSVLAASIVTWAVAGLVLTVSGLSVLAVGVAGDLVLEEIERQQPGTLADSGLSQDALVTSLVVFGSIMAVAALVAIVLAVFVLRDRPWARSALMSLSLVTAVLCVVVSLWNFAAVLPALGAILVAALLRRPESRDWFASRKG